jgi:dihydrofolate reductase/adenylate kinase family enzyme
MKVIILGNAGAGKSTLARTLIARQPAARLSLDEVAFLGGAERRPLQDSVEAVKRWISEQDSWIIEGCYADILEPVLACADELIFLNPGIEACLAHCRSRPWEPEKFSSRQEQDANLDNLLQWVGSYETRADEYGLSRHRALYESFAGKKRELCHPEAYPSTRCSVFIATSLDGCIARSDGSIDWLERANASAPAGEDCGYADFMQTVDALVMGRATFEKVLSFPDWPYGGLPVYVLSSTISSLPAGVPDSVHLLSATPHGVVERTAAAGHRHLYIDGGRNIQGFLRAGLITELTITVIPMVLGSGLRLFGELPTDTELRLLSSKAFPFGFVQSHYAVCQKA